MFQCTSAATHRASRLADALTACHRRPQSTAAAPIMMKLRHSALSISRRPRLAGCPAGPFPGRRRTDPDCPERRRQPPGFPRGTLRPPATGSRLCHPVVRPAHPLRRVARPGHSLQHALARTTHTRHFRMAGASTPLRCTARGTRGKWHGLWCGNPCNCPSTGCGERLDLPGWKARAGGDFTASSRSLPYPPDRWRAR